MPTAWRPSARSISCSAISRATRSWASTVEAPRCGVQTTRGCWINCQVVVPSFGGSWTKTSRAAPLQRSEIRASSRAASSTIPPRAMLIMRTVDLQRFSASALIRSALIKIPLIRIELGIGERMSLTVRLRHVRRVNGDVVGQRPDFLQFHFVDFKFSRWFFANYRIVADSLNNKRLIIQASGAKNRFKYLPSCRMLAFWWRLHGQFVPARGSPKLNHAARCPCKFSGPKLHS